MKLTIKRNQADVKGMFGGHKGVKFSLYAKADITSEEMGLINKYKVNEDVLTTYKIDSEITIYITVDKLINGFSTETKNISMLLDLEDKIKGGCQGLKTLLSVMGTFGGEEVIEI